jgi:hypothetical protein
MRADTQVRPNIASFSPASHPFKKIYKDAHRAPIRWRASGPAAFGGKGFQPVRLHRQDAGATKSFSGQFLMGRWPTRKA